MLAVFCCGRPPPRSALGARPVPGAGRRIDRRGPSPQRRSGPAGRAPRLHQVLGGRAPQPAWHRQLGPGRPRGPARGGHLGHPGRLRGRDASQPPAADRGRAVRHAGGAAPRADRPRDRPRPRHRPRDGAHAAGRRRRAAGRFRQPARGTAGVLRPSARRPANQDPGHPGRGQPARAVAARVHRLQRRAGRPARPAVCLRLSPQRRQRRQRQAGARALPEDVHAVRDPQTAVQPDQRVGAVRERRRDGALAARIDPAVGAAPQSRAPRPAAEPGGSRDHRLLKSRADGDRRGNRIARDR